MPFHLNFEKRQSYDSLASGITIDAILRYGSHQASCMAKIDTGSEVCLFERDIGELLGIDVESGNRKQLSTLTGNLMAYGHEIEMETLGLRFQSFIFFPESYAVHRNLLGRQGWLQFVKVGLVDYDCTLYLSLYDE